MQILSRIFDALYKNTMEDPLEDMFYYEKPASARKYVFTQKTQKALRGYRTPISTDFSAFLSNMSLTLSLSLALSLLRVPVTEKDRVSIFCATLDRMITCNYLLFLLATATELPEYVAEIAAEPRAL